MADRTGRSGPTPPRYRVDGQLTDNKPPKADRRPIAGVERPPDGGRPVVVYGAAQERPAFPLRPLDLGCVKPATLSAEDRAEVVRLVRLVQTDFNPERDPRGWESVADIVRGAGRTPDEVRQMDYPALAAFFRVNHEAQKIRLGGTIETTTPSIVSYNAAPVSGQGVFRVAKKGHDTREIDVDGPLGKLETQLRKQFETEYERSESAVMEAMIRELYCLSSEDLRLMLERRLRFKVSERTIRRKSKRYASWERYRRPAPPASADVDVGPAASFGRPARGADAAGDTLRGWRHDAGLSDVRPSAADAAADAINSGHLSKRTGGRGTTRIGKTATEKEREDAADRFARDAGVDLPPAE